MQRCQPPPSVITIPKPSGSSSSSSSASSSADSPSSAPSLSASPALPSSPHSPARASAISPSRPALKNSLLSLTSSASSSSTFSSALMEDRAIVNLQCPLSSRRIKIPCKGRDCHHHQCFDLEVRPFGPLIVKQTLCLFVFSMS